MYDLAKKKQLIQFDKDCAEAAGKCPQSRYEDHELQILRKEMNAKDVYKAWDKCPILWKSGYWEALDYEALETFEAIRNAQKEAKKSFFKKKCTSV